MSILAIGLLVALAASAPSPGSEAKTSSSITAAPQLSSIIAAFEAEASSFATAGSNLEAIFLDIFPPTIPDSIPDAVSQAVSAYSAHPSDSYQRAASLVFNGVCPGNIVAVVEDFEVFNSNTNYDNPLPESDIYPKSSTDAPYDVPELDLRAAMYIPPSFTYGAKQPVLLVPGTGGYAGEQFATNFATVFAYSPNADPVYLNIPNNSLDDVQTNAEYVAYGINYLNSITGRKVATYGWSQAAVTVRWATKYWPSTRSAASVSIQISPDYHGSITQYLDYPISDGFSAASVLQQSYNSTFIATLRNNGGDSAYVPLTSIYSGFDDVVQPQVSGPDASGFSYDAHNVGVTNIFLQDICGAVLPGGSPQNVHEGVLYNALALALADDSLTTGKNANLAHVDTASLCAEYAAAGMSLDDVAATITNIIIAGVNIIDAPNKSFSEPKIKAYARKDIPPGYSG